ncbi:F-actin capping protein alpha subunit [Tritrichomonas foetus]|uniref:F-actin-capping protein subunit alpha n=1 Tax=Tritrichomonas foetus TaxID=1144522 RepID=A0A1J4JH92_9EUKA|nr:F-actin capping protein alpha subunit [Tritrichomonas foetus]|eukprot:OHS96853.1 F-actin capping protein alpha subunit [Tritrichomonas foetus]
MAETKIVKNFLENAHPGEFTQCKELLESVSPSTKKVIKKNETKLYRNWAFNNYLTVSVGTHTAILCSEAQQSDGSFIDPVDFTSFTYDFKTKQIKETGMKPTTKSSKLRTKIQQKLKNYVESAYHEDFAFGVFDLPDDSIVIIIVSFSVSLENYRTGSVVSRYVLSDSTLKGETKMKQHFFETGNVMCENGAKLKDVHIDEETPEDISDHVLDEIISFEEKWLENVNKAFVQVNQEALKKLRRKVTIVREKIDWRRLLTVGVV